MEKKDDAAKPAKKDREKKPGTGLLATGGVMLGVGVAGIIVAGVGVRNANEAEDKIEGAPPGPARRNGFDQGQRANNQALAGAIVAGVGLGTGIALIVAGAVKRKRGSSSKTEARLAPTVLPGVRPDQPAGGGFVVQGSF